jgi:molybdopterin converting factor small subunit
MSIRVHLYSNLQRFTGNQPIVEVDGTTVGQCLLDLVKKYPAISSVILDNHQELLSTVFVSLNLKSARSENLEKPVDENDQLYIILIVAGG